MSVTRTFLAWQRTGLVTVLTGAPAVGAARAAVSVGVRLRDTDYETHIPVELLGPGDVAGLDPRQIRRTEPYDACADYEPSYLAYIELVDADLPWRFSPLGATSTPLPDPEHPSSAPGRQQYVRPWLALVVVPADVADFTPATASGGLPTLSCDSSQLPNPSETWASAHVQVSTVDGQDLAQAVTDPSRCFARLLCPRLLTPATRFLACLVPTFAAGLSPGVTPVGSDPLAPAWASFGSARLPVYFSYTFTTGQAGSFETLARQLRPRQAPDSCYGRVIATDAPGWGADGPTTASSASTVMQGAFRSLNAPASSPGDDADHPPDPDLAQRLTQAVSADGTGLQLRPPLYGQDYVGGATVVSATDTGWFAQLNTDPRRRLAAGLAAWAVAVDRDDLVNRAWQQLELGLRPPTTADPHLAAILTATLIGRHLTGGTIAAPPTLTRLARPGGALSPNGGAAALLSSSHLGGTWSAAQAMIRSTRTDDGRAVAASGRDLFAPIFDDPAYTLLRSVAPEWLLPGAGDVPDDSVIVLRTNPAFTDAFLIGLNHALARELLWRRYPLDPTKKMFHRFWATAPGQDSSDNGAGDELVLLIRGALLRRFPTAAVYLSSTDANNHETHLPPNLAATLGPGTAFFGFPLTLDQVKQPPSAGSSGWSIVIQEAVDHTRFGVNDAPVGDTAQLSDWQKLDRGHPQLRGQTHIPVAVPPAVSAADGLPGITRPLTSAAGSPAATWAANAGELAGILQRPAFRIRIPIALWLPTTNHHN